MPRRTFQTSAGPVVLDARPDRLDLRDRPYLPPVRSLPPRYPDAATLSRYLSGYVKAGLILDQGKEGACTGYGLAAVANYLIWTRALEGNALDGFLPVSPHMLYDLAQFYDEWPGEDYEGSSCRGAMKGWHKHGVCDAARWDASVRRQVKRPYKPAADWATDAANRPVGVYYRVDPRSVVDMQAAILNMGAIYVSGSVHDGWSLPEARVPKSVKAIAHDNLPVITYDPAAGNTGAHAFALVGYNDIGFVVQNSWGTDWGASGFATLTYADWVANGADAWVCSLGVPQATQPNADAVVTRAPTRQSSGASLLSGDTGTGTTATAGLAPAWPTQRAYQHTLVAGNNGLVRMSLPDVGTAEGLANLIVRDNLGQWLAGRDKATRKVVLYAHGGLNNEEASLTRIRVMAPYFLANGIYPLFYTWRTGALESVQGKLADALGFDAAGAVATGVFADARDALLEAAAHASRWIWNEMKDNADRAREPGRAIALMAERLAALQKKYAGTEFHLVGHSAGSFVHGHLLALMKAAGAAPASLTLYAPACSLEFALDKLLKPQVPKDKLWLHLLDDTRERADTTGPYGKSLLYLVSRGFEDTRKTPLAGLQRCLDPTALNHDDSVWHPGAWEQVALWRDRIGKLPAQADGRPACELTTTSHVSTGRKMIPAAHGSFDNDREVIERTINRILGNVPSAPLAVPVDDLGY